MNPPSRGITTCLLWHLVSEPLPGTQDPCLPAQLSLSHWQRPSPPRTLPLAPASPSSKSGSRIQLTYLESSAHALAIPDVPLVLGVLADVPVLLGHAGLSGVHAGLPCLHVAEDLDGVQVAALVGINPVFSCVGQGKMESGEVWWGTPVGSGAPIAQP